MELNQGSANLAELAIVFRQAAGAVHLLGRQQAQLGLAPVAPGKYRSGVASTIGRSAMAGGFAAAGLEFVDGAFEQFADRKQRLEELPVLVFELAEELAVAAGAFGS
jgi:hypothetical protein